MSDGKTFFATFRDGIVLRGSFVNGFIKIDEEMFNIGMSSLDIDLSSDGKSYFVCGVSTGGALVEYDSLTNKVIWSAGHKIPGANAAIFLDDNTLVTIHADFKTRVWRKNPAGSTRIPPPLVRTHLESFGDESAYDLEYEGKAHKPLPLRTDALLFDPESFSLVSRGQDQIIVWDAKELLPKVKFGSRCDNYRDYRATASAGAIALTKDGKQVVAADDNGVLYIYDRETGKELGQIQERVIVPIPQIPDLPGSPSMPSPPPVPTVPSNSLPNGLAPMPPSQPTPPPQAAVVATTPESKMCWAIAFDETGKFLYTTHRDGYIRIWNFAEKKMIDKVMKGNIGANLCLAPGNKMIASLLTANDHGVVNFSRSDESQTMRTIYQERVSANSHNSTGKFSSDGTSYFQALSDGRLEEWKITESGSVMPGKEFLRLPSQIMDFQIAEDDQTMFVGSISAKIPFSVWNMQSGQMLWQAPPSHPPVWRIQILPEGRIATLGVDNVLRTYVRRKKAEE